MSSSIFDFFYDIILDICTVMDYHTLATDPTANAILALISYCFGIFILFIPIILLFKILSWGFNL